VQSGSVIQQSPTFSMRETYMLAKQGKLGTKGFKVMRGNRKACKSTTW